jgi:hypothetical protein
VNFIDGTELAVTIVGDPVSICGSSGCSASAGGRMPALAPSESFEALVVGASAAMAAPDATALELLHVALALPAAAYERDRGGRGGNTRLSLSAARHRQIDRSPDARRGRASGFAAPRSRPRLAVRTEVTGDRGDGLASKPGSCD